jgi:hypothetical protein
MQPADPRLTLLDRELAAMHGRLEAAQRDVVAAIGAIGAILAVIGGWTVV